MLGLWAGLLAWAWSAPWVGCPVAALVLVPLWLLLTSAGSELALLRRSTFVRQYLEPRGHLARWLGRRLLVLGWQAIKSLVPAVLLLLGVIWLEAIHWAVLAADLLLFATLIFVMDWGLVGELNPAYNAVLVRHWAHRLNALVLWSALTTTLYFSAHEDYRGMGPVAVVRLSAGGVSLGCDDLAVLARLGSASDALLWWAAEHLFGGLSDPAEQAVAWVGFLAAFGASFLLAWAYSRALVGVLARPWQVTRGTPGDA